MTSTTEQRLPPRPPLVRRFPGIVFAAGLLLFAGAGVLRAQTDTLVLSLAECIRMAQINGPSGASARYAYEAKERRYDAFTATLDRKSVV